MDKLKKLLNKINEELFKDDITFLRWFNILIFICCIIMAICWIIFFIELQKM